MSEDWTREIEHQLRASKLEFEQRLQRISENHRRPLESDSKERATQMENLEVVDALGNETLVELRDISAALIKLEDGVFGACEECEEPIGRQRLQACPQAQKCIYCAELDDDRRRFAG